MPMPKGLPRFESRKEPLPATSFGMNYPCTIRLAETATSLAIARGLAETKGFEPLMQVYARMLP
jgi:hypothetical protein